MYRFIRTAVAALAIGLLFAVPAAIARPIDGPGMPRPTEPVWPGPPTWPVDPEPIVSPQPATVADDGGVAPLAYILPAGAIALMAGATLAYVAGPRRARVKA